MKESLRTKLLAEIEKINARCNQLNEYRKEYKEDNDYEGAMKCDIKWRELKMVSQSLKNIL